MDLSGFSAFDFSEGVPYFSVTLNGLTFNKAVVLKLGSPAYVRLLINEESRQVVLQVCEETTPKATTFYKPKKNGVLSVRWSSAFWPQAARLRHIAAESSMAISFFFMVLLLFI